MLLLRLSQVFRVGAIISPLNPKSFGFAIIAGRRLCFSFDLAKYFDGVQPCHLYTPKTFLDFPLLREGAFCFCFDVARVFLQGATMPPLYPRIFCHQCWEGDRNSPGHYASASTYLGIASWSRHAHPTLQKSRKFSRSRINFTYLLVILQWNYAIMLAK